jgi:hypothetical protein
MDKKYSGGGSMAIGIVALAQRLGGYENKPLAIVLVIGAGVLVCVLTISALLDVISKVRAPGDSRIVLTGRDTVARTRKPVFILVASILLAFVVVSVGFYALYPRPDFRLSMLGCNIFVPDDAPDLTGIAIETQIHNIGSSSFATNWTLDVRTKQDTVKAQFTAMPESLTLHGNAGAVVLHASQSLEGKTIATFGDGDAPIRGVLLFWVLREIRG